MQSLAQVTMLASGSVSRKKAGMQFHLTRCAWLCTYPDKGILRGGDMRDIVIGYNIVRTMHSNFPLQAQKAFYD